MRCRLETAKVPKHVFSRPSDSSGERERLLLSEPLAHIRACLLMASVCCASPSAAFPPYGTTDAETAGASAVEFRLGLVQVEKIGSESERQTPLTNLNFGVGPHFEITSELEYAAEERRLGEAALGFKWAAARGVLNIGVETMTLLPVQSEQEGVGIESQLLVTFAREQWQIHGNAGLFNDPRGDETERGWRASILAEFPREKLQPGVELFAREAHGESTSLQVGAGVIASFARMMLHAGLHIGLTDAAPDWEGNVWLSWKWRSKGNE